MSPTDSSRGLLCALLLLTGMPFGEAHAVELSLRGELEDGGHFHGRFRYDANAVDREPSPLLDLFALQRWTVTVTLGDGQEFLFESTGPNPAAGAIGIDPSPAQIFLEFGDPSGQIDPSRPLLQVVFGYLGPVPLSGTPPALAQWGPFDPLLPGEVGIGSSFGTSIPGQPGPTEFIRVTGAVIPETAAPVLPLAGLFGLGMARILRSRA